MTPLPEAIITVSSALALWFSPPVWNHVQVLITGAVLCQGPYTVAAGLRVMGLGQERRLARYPRVLSRDRGSGLHAAQILLGLVVRLLPAHRVPIGVVDDTVERRQGKQIRAKGCYRDALGSTKKQVVKGLGLKWISLMRIVRLPWCSRPWALPFLTVLAPSERANQQQGKRHKTTGDWTRQRIKGVSRGFGQRPWLLGGDGAYAGRRLAWTWVAQQAIWVSRLRLDAQLYEFPPAAGPGRRGPKPQQGPRLPALASRVAEAQR
jgi:hypothetical protein